MTTQLAGLTVGYPMLDSALVDFSLRLPARYKLRGLTLRWFFKEGAARVSARCHHSKEETGVWLAFRHVAHGAPRPSGLGPRLAQQLGHPRIRAAGVHRLAVAAPPLPAPAYLRRDDLGPDDARAVAAGPTGATPDRSRRSTAEFGETKRCWQRRRDAHVTWCAKRTVREQRPRYCFKKMIPRWSRYLPRPYIWMWLASICNLDASAS
jgi:hypothetical protein